MITRCICFRFQGGKVSSVRFGQPDGNIASIRRSSVQQRGPQRRNRAVHTNYRQTRTILRHQEGTLFFLLMNNGEFPFKQAWIIIIMIIIMIIIILLLDPIKFLRSGLSPRELIFIPIFNNIILNVHLPDIPPVRLIFPQKICEKTPEIIACWSHHKPEEGSRPKMQFWKM